jgi:hypothetical protein
VHRRHGLEEAFRHLTAGERFSRDEYEGWNSRVKESAQFELVFRNVRVSRQDDPPSRADLRQLLRVIRLRIALGGWEVIGVDLDPMAGGAQLLCHDPFAEASIQKESRRFRLRR